MTVGQGNWFRSARLQSSFTIVFNYYYYLSGPLFLFLCVSMDTHVEQSMNLVSINR